LRFADRPASYRREAERKEIQNKKTMKKNLQLILSVTLCVFGCVLLVTGFILPPLAEIHHSVLIAFGEILTFAGSLIGIDYKYRYKE
jgi:O-antigen/teichoic acid export membrane protein